MLTFTFRELKRAWENSSSIFDEATNKTNAHRLLLFYAVEVGLKALVLKRAHQTDTEGRFEEIKHDLNKLIDILRIGNEFRLIEDIQLSALKYPERPRNKKIGDLNQIWRYGAEAKQPADRELEQQLLKIQEKIRGELK